MDATAPRHVLIMVEDPQLADLLLDALCDAGHTGALANIDSLPAVLASETFDAAIVDLDTRARDGATIVALLRARAPHTTVLALLPCGGLPPGRDPVPYHLSLEKPARLRAVMTALSASHAISRN